MGDRRGARSSPTLHTCLAHAAFTFQNQWEGSRLILFTLCVNCTGVRPAFFCPDEMVTVARIGLETEVFLQLFPFFLTEQQEKPGRRACTGHDTG